LSLLLQAEAVFFLVLAALLSVIIGMDRERRNRPAGLRTHMLVGIGACLFTLLSVHAFPGSDPARIASQIVVGIGFLGAGTIIQSKTNVHDLTTAASIWVTAAMGMAVGAGAWFLALAATVIVWIVLAVIRRFSKDEPVEESHPKGP
jgi:putative Mg2+ transporter-C (MgtC) family protein